MGKPCRPAVPNDRMNPARQRLGETLATFQTRFRPVSLARRFSQTKCRPDVDTLGSQTGTTGESWFDHTMHLSRAERGLGGHDVHIPLINDTPPLETCLHLAFSQPI